MYLRHYKYDAEYLMEEASERERETQIDNVYNMDQFGILNRS